jgi:hypothetical protein
MSKKVKNGSKKAVAGHYRNRSLSAKASFFDLMSQILNLKLTFSAAC